MTGARRIDPETGATLTLSPDGLSVELPGRAAIFIPAPPGYSLSHFTDGMAVVGRGEAPRDGWWDWQFETDLEARRLRRAGPAY